MSQNWQKKELVKVSGDIIEPLRQFLLEGCRNIVLYEAPEGLRLGDYRKLAVSKSTETFVCQ